MSKILCSTGALLGLPNNRNHKLLKKLSQILDCDGYEFMMYSSWYEKADEIVEDIKIMKLNIPVMHCEKHIGEAISRGEFEEAFRLFTINCDIAKRLSIDKMVIHLWDGQTSDQHFENNLYAYETLDEISNQYGVDLLVENVVCNKENPMKHWCELTEKYPEIHYVFDTKMAAFHQQIELLYEDKYEWLWKNNHIRHFHVNDYAGGYMDWANLRTLPVGDGNVDFDRFFQYIKETGYDGTFTVEATAFQKDGSVDVGMLNRCFGKVREYINKR